MDRLYLMSVYVAVADEQSFAGAARRLGMSPPAVTRAIASLEARLGIKLLNRTTRYVRATDAGLRYLEHARHIIAEADAADEDAAGAKATPRGQLTVTAPVLFGRMFVMPSIVDYLQRFPEVTVSTMFLDRFVNLLEEGMDVGIRIGELPDSTMNAISVGHIRRIVCASPEYLRKHGVPKLPTDLSKHTIITASAVTPSLDWRFFAGKQTIIVKVKPRLTVTNNESAVAAAAQGFGITRLLSYQIASHVAAGQLQTLLNKYEPPPLPIHVLHREGRHASAKVRAFVDMLVEQLRKNKTLN
jgi:DNA-binding transcriptional LysR family regulator